MQKTYLCSTLPNRVIHTRQPTVSQKNQYPRKTPSESPLLLKNIPTFSETGKVNGIPSSEFPYYQRGVGIMGEEKISGRVVASRGQRSDEKEESFPGEEREDED